jgi:hypothetical protein
VSTVGAEDLLAIHLKELGVDFERQYAYVPGRKFKADFVMYPAVSGQMSSMNWTMYRQRRPILIEVQGGIFSKKAHGSISGILNDNARLNFATKHGYRVLRFTTDEVNDGRAKAFIADVLGVTGDGSSQ